MEPESLDHLILQNDERHNTLKNIEANSEYQLQLQDKMAQGIEDLNKTAEHLLLQGDKEEKQIQEVKVVNDGEDLANLFLKALKGKTGEKGEQGEQGIQGEKGERGDQGEKGERGGQGDQGIQGEKGQTGEKGDQGIQGKTGPKGAKGDRGESYDPETLKELDQRIEFYRKQKQSSQTIKISEIRTVVEYKDEATVVPNVDTTDILVLKTLSQTTVFANPVGTPTQQRQLEIMITSSSSRTLSFGDKYSGSSTVPLPTTTSGSGMTDHIGLRYNIVSGKWECLATSFGYA